MPSAGGPRRYRVLGRVPFEVTKNKPDFQLFDPHGRGPNAGRCSVAWSRQAQRRIPTGDRTHIFHRRVTGRC